MNIRRFFAGLRPRSRRPRVRHDITRRLAPVRLERLERRTLLAGNVTAQLSGMNAIFRGDAADNSVEVVAEDGNVIVRGLDGTTINGSAADLILVNGAIGGNLNAVLGDGNDRFVVNGVSIGRNASVSGGRGNDEIAFVGMSTIGTNVAIAGLDGNDVLSLQNSTVGRHLTLAGHRGDDLLIVSTATIGGNLAVNGGTGNNDIAVDGSRIGRDTRIATGNDHDEVVIRNSELVDDLYISTARGTDVVVLDSTTVGDKSVIRTGSGTDHVLIDGTTRFFDRTWLSGGRAPDHLEITDGVVFDGLRTNSISRGVIDEATINGRIRDGVTGALGRAEAAVAAFEQQLALTINLPSVSEGAGDGAAILTVTRHGDISDALVVDLASSDTDKLVLEQTMVTIPAGQDSVSVLLNPQDNAIEDGTTTVTLTAMSADGRNGAATIDVTDDDGDTLTVAIAESQIDEDSGNQSTIGAAIGFDIVVSRNGDTTDELFVSLSTSVNGVISVPATVTIPAGQNSATVSAQTVPDGVPETDVSVVVTAGSPGFQSGTDSILVRDNDAARLTVGFSAPVVTESGDDSTASVTVTRNTDVTDSLSITLTSQDPASLTFGGSATTTVDIPAGEASVTVSVNAVPETLVDGNKAVTVVAAAPGFADGSSIIEAQDDDSLALTVTVTSGDTVAENAGADAVTIRVERNTEDLSSPLTVMLMSSDTARLTAPATATIPAGESQIDVLLSPVDDNLVNVPANAVVFITASATNFADGGHNVTVENDDVATITLSPGLSAVAEDAGTTVLTVSRNDTSGAETIDLAYSDSGLITGPASVDFTAGQDMQSVTLTVIDNDLFGENNDVTVTASSPNHSSVTATIRVNNDDALTLTTNTSANSSVESVGTTIVKSEFYNITGVTAPGTIIQADNDGDQSFDEASVVADASGNYSIDVPLVHDATNRGANVIQLRALPSTGEDLQTPSTVMNVHRAVGTVVRFETNQDLDNDTVLDFFDAELLDSDAPITVTNFLSYTTTAATGTERYDNLLVQRSDDNFVIQAGRYNVNGQSVTEVDRDADNNGLPDTIQNEFMAANSNLFGTLSMALPSGQPNGGSSEWFINTSDNTFLDDPTRLHTVFGRVIGSGMDVVTAINTVPTFDLRTELNESALGELPLVESPFIPVTGSISLTQGSSVVTGTDTQFTSELQVGDFLRIGSASVQVLAVTSDTELTVDFSASSDVSGLSAGVFRDPQNDDYIIFSNIGEILGNI